MVLIPVLAFAFAFAQAGPADDLPAKYRPAAPGPNVVVAKVNGVEIRAGDVEGLLWEWRGFDAIQDLISYQLVRAEAQKQRVDVSQKDVETALEAGIKQMADTLPPGKTVDTALIEQGFSRSRLYLRYRTEALITALLDRSFNPKQLVKVSTINFKPTSEQASAVADAIKRAQDGYDRLKKGDSWETVLAAAVSDPAVQKTKGMLGWRDLDAFPATVRTELEALKAGEFTKPAQTQFGIQIFRVEAVGKNAKPEDLTEMKQVYEKAARGQLLERLRKEGDVQRLYPAIPGLNSQKDGN